MFAPKIFPIVCSFLFFVKLLISVSFERRRKSTGVGKNGIGLCQLPVGVGGVLQVCSGWDCREKGEGDEEQKEEMRGGKQVFLTYVRVGKMTT